MVNMKLSSEKAAEMYGETMSSEAPKYPYGLQISLDEEALEKLGMPGLPEVGMTMSLVARVEVVSTSKRDTQEDGEERCLSLQITDLELGPEKEETDFESALYGRKE
jgi:hypothetical protein